VRLSMGTVADCFDNAMCESFFATLECELLARTRFDTREQASQALFSWIEGWYNANRRHSAIGYHSPIHYEKRHEQQSRLHFTDELPTVVGEKGAPPAGRGQLAALCKPEVTSTQLLNRPRKRVTPRTDTVCRVKFG